MKRQVEKKKKIASEMHWWGYRLAGALGDKEGKAEAKEAYARVPTADRETIDADIRRLDQRQQQWRQHVRRTHAPLNAAQCTPLTRSRESHGAATGSYTDSGRS
jgi:hypothetical protein